MSEKTDNGDTEFNSFPRILKRQSIEKSAENRIPKVRPIPLDKLVPFRNHPFQTYEGVRLEKLAE